MKRMLALILAVLLTAALCGCGSDPAPSTSGSSSTPVAAPAGSESGSKDYAIVAACGYGVGTPLWPTPLRRCTTTASRAS